MAAKITAVFGTYRRQEELEDAVGSLIIKGFPSETISALIPEQLSQQEHKPVPVGEPAELIAKHELAHGTVGLLDDVGAVWVHDVGQLLGAGPVMRALADSEEPSEPGTLAAVLQRMGARAAEAKRCERVLARRGLLMVSCRDAESAARAKQVLQRTGAEGLPSADLVEMPKVRHGGTSPI